MLWCLVDKRDEAVVAFDYVSPEEAAAALPHVAAEFKDPVDLEVRVQSTILNEW